MARGSAGASAQRLRSGTSLGTSLGRVASTPVEAYLLESLHVPMSRLLSAVVLATLAAGPALAQAPAPGDAVINEAMYDPPSPQPPGNEWVEVLNVSGGPLDLGGLAVSDGGTPSAGVPAGTTLPAGGFLVLVDNGAAFAAAYPSVPFIELARFPTLNNTGDRPALVLDDAEIDAVPYLPTWGGDGASLERRDPLGPSDAASNFGTSTAAASGTPGAQNSLFALDQTAPALVSAQALDAQSVLVTFSEPLDPASAEAEANYRVDGGIGAPVLASLQDDRARVMLALAAPLASPRSYTLTVTGVADRRGNAGAAQTTTFFFGQGEPAQPRDLVVNEFLYDEPAADNPGEFVELFNRTDKAFDLRDFTLNDGTGDDRPVTAEARFVAPGGYAVVVEDGEMFAAVFPDVPFVEQPEWSALNNSGDAVVLRYRGAVVDSLRYTSAWGGEDVSLERKDPDGPSVRANFAPTADLDGGTPGERNSQFAPDVAGPMLVAAMASRDGQTVTVTLDEPADPASVTPGAFAVTGGPAVTATSYDDGALTVTLALSAPLAAGASTVTATGLRDPLGNTTATASVPVEFAPDTQDPALARATAPDATTVRATFTEPVTAASATSASYEIAGGPGASQVTVDDESDGGVTAVLLTLDAPLTDQTLYTLAATGLIDLAGRTASRSEARFFFGTPDAPALGEIVVTEIMYDPAVGSAGEYLEVANTTADRVFDLGAVTLDDGDGDGAPLADGPAVLLPGETLALVRDADGFRPTFPEAPFVEAGSVISLSNSGEAVVLRAAGAVVDSVFYDPGWHRVELEDAMGISLERRDPAGPSNLAANWSSSLAEAGGTPSAANSVSISDTPVERETALVITSPFAPTLGEASEITYTLSGEVGLVRARIYDGGGRRVRELEPGRLSGQTATLVWDGTGDDRRPLRAGIYVVLVEAVDAQGGTTDAIRGAVVLARPDGP